MTYRYFISWIDTATGHVAGGDTVLDYPIRGMDDVKKLRESLMRQGHREPVVLGFSRFED